MKGKTDRCPMPFDCDSPPVQKLPKERRAFKRQAYNLLWFNPWKPKRLFKKKKQILHDSTRMKGRSFVPSVYPGDSICLMKCSRLEHQLVPFNVLLPEIVTLYTTPLPPAILCGDTMHGTIANRSNLSTGSLVRN